MNRLGLPSRVRRTMRSSKYSIQPETVSPSRNLMATGVCFSLKERRYSASCPVSPGGGVFCFLRGEYEAGMTSLYLLARRSIISGTVPHGVVRARGLFDRDSNGAKVRICAAVLGVVGQQVLGPQVL